MTTSRCWPSLAPVDFGEHYKSEHRGGHSKEIFPQAEDEKAESSPFFVGEITYRGEFSREVMALLELGRLIHVGKMATFGNGMYEVKV